MAEREHVTHEIDHCPVCKRDKEDCGIDGYDEIDFTMNSVLLRYRCKKCGTGFCEEYTYTGTYHYTYDGED